MPLPAATVNCRHFRGDKPCRLHKDCADEACPDHAAIRERILIIKLGAMGDVLRTAVILPPLRARHPNAQIIWLTRAESAPLIETHPALDHVWTYSPSTTAALALQHFDAVYCPEHDPAATALSGSIRSGSWHGIVMDSNGNPAPASTAAMPFWRMAFNDTLKFRENQKSMPRLVLDALELADDGKPCTLQLTDTDRRDAAQVLERLGGTGPLIGFNVGAGDKFPTKAWPLEHFARLHTQVREAGLGTTLLLGGDAEMDSIRSLAGQCPGTLALDRTLPVRVFAALIEKLKALVTGDTLAFHLAVAVGRPVVCLVGPTAPQELDAFGRGEIIAQPPHCAPCYLARCPYGHECMTAITPESVLAALRRQC